LYLNLFHHLTLKLKNFKKSAKDLTFARYYNSIKITQNKHQSIMDQGTIRQNLEDEMDVDSPAHFISGDTVNQATQAPEQETSSDSEDEPKYSNLDSYDHDTDDEAFGTQEEKAAKETRARGLLADLCSTTDLVVPESALLLPSRNNHLITQKAR
jgi:hypothetical protein